MREEGVEREGGGEGTSTRRGGVLQARAKRWARPPNKVVISRRRVKSLARCRTLRCDTRAPGFIPTSREQVIVRSLRRSSRRSGGSEAWYLQASCPAEARETFSHCNLTPKMSLSEQNTAGTGQTVAPEPSRPLSFTTTSFFGHLFRASPRRQRKLFSTR